MTTLMTAKEMLRRIANDEEPLDLSIDKWERNAKYVEENGDPFKIPIGYDTCALCFEVEFSPGATWVCYNCQYYKHHGRRCFSDDSSSVYWRIADATYGSNRSLIVDLIKELIAELKAIKEGK